MTKLEKAGYVWKVTAEAMTSVSGDINGMFHQIRLLPEDTHLLQFVWRDLENSREPSVDVTGLLWGGVVSGDFISVLHV